MDSARAQYWSSQIPKLQSDVRNHRDNIKEKVIEIKGSINNGGNNDLEAKKLELLERQVAAQEAMSASSTNQTIQESDAKRSNSLI